MTDARGGVGGDRQKGGGRDRCEPGRRELSWAGVGVGKGDGMGKGKAVRSQGDRRTFRACDWTFFDLVLNPRVLGLVCSGSAPLSPVREPGHGCRRGHV